MASTNRGYMPQSDSGLLSFAQHFHTTLEVAPASWGVTTPQVDQLEGLITVYSEKLSQVVPEIRSKASVAQKNAARAELRSFIMELAGIVAHHPGVTDAMLTELGLTVRKHPTPIPAPTDVPDIDIKSVNGRTVTIRVHNGDVLVRRKPDGVSTFSAFAFFGEEPSPDPTVWTFMGQSGRTEMAIPFGPSDSASTVWLTAFWSNAKGENGPACQPVKVNLPAAATMEIASKMKKAA